MSLSPPPPVWRTTGRPAPETAYHNSTPSRSKRPTPEIIFDLVWASASGRSVSTRRVEKAFRAEGLDLRRLRSGERARGGDHETMLVVGLLLFLGCSQPMKGRKGSDR